mmetsp:Transcript_14929/g.46178  ORF Transcript_14929/g.46178 Transcript_14929/m.46178 type:complete len:345 (+) Transcript_14929:261-1295(+)
MPPLDLQRGHLPGGIALPALASGSCRRGVSELRRTRHGRLDRAVRAAAHVDGVRILDLLRGELRGLCRRAVRPAWAPGRAEGRVPGLRGAARSGLQRVVCCSRRRGICFNGDVGQAGGNVLRRRLAVTGGLLGRAAPPARGAAGPAGGHLLGPLDVVRRRRRRAVPPGRAVGGSSCPVLDLQRGHHLREGVMLPERRSPGREGEALALADLARRALQITQAHLAASTVAPGGYGAVRAHAVGVAHALPAKAEPLPVAVPRAAVELAARPRAPLGARDLAAVHAGEARGAHAPPAEAEAIARALVRALRQPCEQGWLGTVRQRIAILAEALAKGVGPSKVACSVA